MLAAQAEGRKRFDVEAFAVREPVELDELARLPELWLDGLSEADARESGGLDAPLTAAREIRIVAMVSGG
jgi:molybdopterin converting factor small subunit